MTTATLRPNGTVVAGDSITPSGTTHGVTSDDSDSTYFTNADTSNNHATVDLGTVTIGAGSVTKQMRVRARCRAVSTSSQINVAVKLVAESSLHDALCSGKFTQDTTLATREGAWSPVTINQATIDALLCNAWPSVGTDDCRVYELYVDLTYVTIPVVALAAVSPDPYTVASVVPLSWVNTLDVDGDDQTRYEVKVFNEATYGVGFSGLDLDNDVPFWTSGVVLSAATSASTGPLVTGDTYRVAVRVGQTVNGVAHWSAWDTDDFDLSVTTANVQSVTVTPDNTNAKLGIAVARNTGSHAWERVEVQRSFDAGVSWEYVRGGNYMAASGNSFAVDDYETANAQATLYRARATWFSSGLPITGAWVEAAAAASWSSTSHWLKDPLNPSRNRAVILEAAGGQPWGAPQQRVVRQGVFPVVGARNPVVVSDVLSGPASVVKIRTESTAANLALLDLLRGVNLLLQPIAAALTGEGAVASQYIAVSLVEEAWRQPFLTQLRLWTIPYVEIDAPGDDTAGQ